MAEEEGVAMKVLSKLSEITCLDDASYAAKDDQNARNTARRPYT